MGGLGGRQPGASLSTSSTTRLGNDSASPINAKLNLMRKSSGMKPPPFLRKGLSKSAMTESTRPDPPSKLAGLPFDAYKRAESKTVSAFDPGRSMVSAPPIDKKLVDKGKATLMGRRASGMTLFFFSPFIFLILVKHLKPRATFHHLKPKLPLLTMRS